VGASEGKMRGGFGGLNTQGLVASAHRDEGRSPL